MLEVRPVLFSQEHLGAQAGEDSSVVRAGSCESWCRFLASNLPKSRRGLT